MRNRFVIAVNVLESYEDQRMQHAFPLSNSEAMGAGATVEAEDEAGVGA
jgi:hypothetical protein